MKVQFCNRHSFVPFLYKKEKEVQKQSFDTPKATTNNCICGMYYKANYLNTADLNFKSKIHTITKAEDLTYEILDKAVKNRRNLIGFGCEGNVYKIPKSVFCIKIPHGVKDIYDLVFNIQEQDKVNHIVAKGAEGVFVMKYIEGKTLFDIKEKSQEVYSLPLEAYKSLFRQISEANLCGLKFDFASSNVIYNKKDKSLTAIDFYDPNPDDEIYLRPITEAYSCLKAIMQSESGAKEHKQLINKFLNIILDELSQPKNSDFIIEKDDIVRFFEKIRDDIPQEMPPQYKFLREAVEDMIDIKQKDFLDSNDIIELNGKNKVAKCITNQIFV